MTATPRSRLWHSQPRSYGPGTIEAGRHEQRASSGGPGVYLPRRGRRRHRHERSPSPSCCSSPLFGRSVYSPKTSRPAIPSCESISGSPTTLHDRRSSEVNMVMYAVTALGSAWVLVPLAGTTLDYILHRRSCREALPVTLAIVGAEALTLGLKAGFERERPLCRIGSPASAFSFPGGHATVSLALSDALAYLGARSLHSAAARLSVVSAAALTGADDRLQPALPQCALPLRRARRLERRARLAPKSPWGVVADQAGWLCPPVPRDRCAGRRPGRGRGRHGGRLAAKSAAAESRRGALDGVTVRFRLPLPRRCGRHV